MEQLPKDLYDMVMAAVAESGELGITAAGVKRRCAGNRYFARLVNKAVAMRVEAGELEGSTHPATGGSRGRPRNVLKVRGNDAAHQHGS